MDGIADSLSGEQPSVMETQIQLIRQAARTLQTFPKRGRPGRISGTRELVVSGTPYFLVYAMQEQLVEVLAVIHGARRWLKSLPQSRPQ